MVGYNERERERERERENMHMNSTVAVLALRSMGQMHNNKTAAILRTDLTFCRLNAVLTSFLGEF